MNSAALSLLTLASILASSPALADDPPVALAGMPFLAYPGEHIVLDGSESYDPEQAALTFAWSQLYGPRVDLLGAESPNPEFDAVESGTYSFQLIVDDGLQGSDPDIVDVIVVDPAIGGDLDTGGCSTLRRSGGALLLLPALFGLLLRRREG